MHSVQNPSSQSRHQTSDGLKIWRVSHIPQKDGEVDMMLISCNIRETNSSYFREQKRIIENEIHELRTKINNHLERLQENLMTELDEAEIQVTDETRELLVSLDEKQKELTEYQTNIVNIKKYNWSWSLYFV
jgi:hypothetical protein